MLRNNEEYIPYMLKCIDLIEEKNKIFDVSYIFYTNNNEDKTLELLQKEKKENFQIIEKDYDKEFLDQPRIKKLHYLREDFLQIIKKLDFDYLLMLDSDIFFNYSMIKDSVNILEKKDYDAITTNTVKYDVPFYYDSFSLSTKNRKKYTPNILTDFKFLKFNFWTLWNANNHMDVESAFGGFYMIRSKVIKSNISYIEGNKNIEKNICEHKYFNQQIKNLKFINHITPFWCEHTGIKEIYDKSYDIIKKNNSDNRNFSKFFTTILLYLIIFFLVIYLIFKIYKR
tara:strand:+ start:12 stop:863 length:852 start_codon:yes stop_codon:yes gene_type:complete